MNFHHEGEYAEIRVLVNALAFIIVAFSAFYIVRVPWIAAFYLIAASRVGPL